MAASPAKQLKCKAHYSPPSSSKVKNGWSYISTPYVFMVCIVYCLNSVFNMCAELNKTKHKRFKNISTQPSLWTSKQVGLLGSVPLLEARRKLTRHVDPQRHPWSLLCVCLEQVMILYQPVSLWGLHVECPSCSGAQAQPPFRHDSARHLHSISEPASIMEKYVEEYMWCSIRAYQMLQSSGWHSVFGTSQVQISTCILAILWFLYGNPRSLQTNTRQ
jgi:hypothetical protein